MFMGLSIIVLYINGRLFLPQKSDNFVTIIRHSSKLRVWSSLHNIYFRLRFGLVNSLNKRIY